MARTRQGACKTPGMRWETTISPRHLYVRVDAGSVLGAPFGVSPKRAAAIEQALHDAVEDIAAKIIAGEL